jgi:hypothetical protein
VCCFYPEGGFNLLFFYADLPETLLLNYLVTLTKTMDVPGDACGSGDPITEGYYSGGGYPVDGDWCIAIDDSGGWGLYQWTDNEPGCWVLIRSGRPCLIGVWDAESPYIVADEFPDTLTVNGTDIITRDPLTSICTWSGSGWTLIFAIDICKFTLNGTAKTDPQDSPVGTYGANTVS